MKKNKLIAEIGLNHLGQKDRLWKLINLANKSGADFVKFQYFKTENLFNFEHYKKALNLDENWFKNIKSLEIPDTDFIEIISQCLKNNIKFGISFFSVQEIKNFSDIFLKKLNKQLFNEISFLKIASAEITNYHLLSYIANLQKIYDFEVIISTGLATDLEIKNALNFFSNHERLTLLHCIVEYPPENNNLNLKRIQYLKEKFKVKTGFSDHTIGIYYTLLSLKFEPEYIEKHFTDSRDINIADNPISTTPEEFKILSNITKDLKNIYGNGLFTLTKKEKNELIFARKGIYALKDIKKGEKILDSNIILQRPNLGENDAKFYFQILGKRVKKDIKKYSPLNYNDIE